MFKKQVYYPLNKPLIHKPRKLYVLYIFVKLIYIKKRVYQTKLSRLTV